MYSIEAGKVAEIATGLGFAFFAGFFAAFTIVDYSTQIRDYRLPLALTLVCTVVGACYMHLGGLI